MGIHNVTFPLLPEPECETRASKIQAVVIGVWNFPWFHTLSPVAPLQLCDQSLPEVSRTHENIVDIYSKHSKRFEYIFIEVET